MKRHFPICDLLFAGMWLELRGSRELGRGGVLPVLATQSLFSQPKQERKKLSLVPELGDKALIHTT